MRLVIIESPCAGDIARNVAYARRCFLDSIKRGEAPFASHLIYTQFLDDLLPAERVIGIKAGLAWAAKADLTAVYTDLGTSPGMLQGIMHANDHGRPIEWRSLNAA